MYGLFWKENEMSVESVPVQSILPITESKNENKQIQEITNIKNINGLSDEFDQDKDFKKQALIKKIESYGGKIEVEKKGLEFSIHDKTKQLIVKVIDRNTNEVVREIPSEKVLDIIAQVEEYMGLFIDEKK